MSNTVRLGAATALLTTAVAVGMLHAQEAPQSPLAPLDVLIGEWEGASEGQPGSGKVTREYMRILDGRFIQLRNVVVYPPQEKNPKGETHEDIGIFSFDRGRKRLVFRQFHVEGFVTQYVAEPPGGEGPLVFTSEAIENIPAGWRARETYTVIGPDEIEERFELAQPEKEFELYSRARLKRVRR